MTVSDNIILAERLGDFFKSLGRKAFKATKKMARNVLKNSGRTLEIGANVGRAFASRKPKAALSTLPDMMNVYHTGKDLLLRKLVKVQN